MHSIPAIHGVKSSRLRSCSWQLVAFLLPAISAEPWFPVRVHRTSCLHLGPCALMSSSSSYTSESASTSFSSEIELFLEAPAADWLPFGFARGIFILLGPRLEYILWLSTRTERAILTREEITIWEAAAWGSIAFNHRVLLFSNQQIWLAVALGNCELQVLGWTPPPLWSQEEFQHSFGAPHSRLAASREKRRREPT